MELNHRLQQEREQRGWSQARLAQELDTIVSAVTTWEQDLSVPSPYFQERLDALFASDFMRRSQQEAESTDVAFLWYCTSAVKGEQYP